MNVTAGVVNHLVFPFPVLFPEIAFELFGG